MDHQQEIFDIMATGLLKQRRVAISAGLACSYRGVEGTKCAAGMLIKDEFYDPKIEGRVVCSGFDMATPGYKEVIRNNCVVLPVIEKSLGYKLSDDEIKLVKTVQSDVHDNKVGSLGGDHEARDAEINFLPDLKEIAKRFNLTVPTAE